MAEIGQKRWEFQGFGANVVPKAEVHLGNVGLDSIVMKALAKEQCHRYETANGFTMDICYAKRRAFAPGRGAERVRAPLPVPANRRNG